MIRKKLVIHEFFFSSIYGKLKRLHIVNNDRFEICGSGFEIIIIYSFDRYGLEY